MKKLSCEVSKWWEDLGNNEKNVLINFLYSLELQEYIKINKNGEYIEMKGGVILNEI